MNWMIPANGKMYDHAAAFQKWHFIDWRQHHTKYAVGDTVYIYCTRPFMRVMYKTIVEKTAMTSSDIVDDSEFWHNKDEYTKSLGGKYARLRLQAQVNSDNLSLPCLVEHGLKAAPQGPVKISNDLASYIDINMDDYFSENIFPESDIPNNYCEGSTHTVVVNKYERSSIARQKCIGHNGCKCFVCGFDFEKVYGELGKGFIHVHHIIPLNKIKKEYSVDYKRDLIPVCPNCHAMLHRKINGKCYTWQELHNLVNGLA